jgi:gentisate 1,2-dioxygenase
MTAGKFVELPPNTIHSFINNTEEDVVWITGWRPKGFQKFFGDFGIPDDQEGASEKSVSEAMIRRVMNDCEKYGMYISKQL